MKFKDLPKGYYFIRGVTNVVYVEKLENPDSYPSYITELEAIEVIEDGKNYQRNNHILDDMDIEFKTYEQMRKERKARGARISHITRGLNNGTPLKGKTLQLALDVIGDGQSGDEFMDRIAEKLKSGQPLSEYEHHIMVDVRLVHVRVGV